MLLHVLYSSMLTITPCGPYLPSGFTLFVNAVLYDSAFSESLCMLNSSSIFMAKNVFILLAP